MDQGVEDRVDEFIAEVVAFAAIEHAEAVRRNQEERQRRAVRLRELRLEQRQKHAHLKVVELLRDAMQS